MELIINTKQPPDDWLEKQDSSIWGARYEQSPQWAELSQEIGSLRPIYLQVRDGQKTIASLLLFDQIPWDPNNNRVSRALSDRITGRMKGSLSWLWGPNYFSADPEQQRESTALILDWIDEYGHERKLFEVRGYLSDHVARDEIGHIEAQFEQHGYARKEWGNFVIDLRLSEEELWSGMKSSARKAVKKARRNNLRFMEIKQDEEYDSLWLKSYRSFEKAAGRKVYSPEWFQAIWRHGKGKTPRYYVAQSEKGEIMAVLAMNVFGATAREFHSAMNPQAYVEKIPAQDLLHWEMILAAKALNCEKFNLAGVDPDPQAKKARGIRQFKEKWGGQYLEYPRFSKRF